MWQIGVALLGVTLAMVVTKDRCVIGAASILLVNWVINTILGQADANLWWGFLIVDYLSGLFAIAGLGYLCGGFKLGSVLIGLSYAFECVVHVSYGLSSQGLWPQYHYWWTTFYVAAGQMLFVFGWGLHGVVRNRFRPSMRLPSNQPVSVSPSQAER